MKMIVDEINGSMLYPNGGTEGDCKPDLVILARRKAEKKRTVASYKLGEVIANGIRYFGQEKVVKRHRTAICICHCGESWRVSITKVAGGYSKSCGCNRTRTDSD